MHGRASVCGVGVCTSEDGGLIAADNVADDGLERLLEDLLLAGKGSEDIVEVEGVSGRLGADAFHQRQLIALRRGRHHGQRIGLGLLVVEGPHPHHDSDAGPLHLGDAQQWCEKNDYQEIPFNQGGIS
jgi:hypothetical protein